MKRIPPVLLCVAALLSCVPSTPSSDPDSSKELTSFSFGNPSVTGVIDQEKRAVAVEVPAGTEVTALVAVFSTTGVEVTVGGKAQKSGKTENDFSSAVEYVVKAEDGSRTSYAVTVTPARRLGSEKAITSFGIVEPETAGCIDQGAIAVVVPHATDLSSLVAVFQTTGKAVTVDEVAQESGVTVNDFTEPLTYVVTAEDGSQAAYEVSVTRAPSTEKAITGFSILEPAAAGLIDGAARVIRARLPEGTILGSLVAVFSATGTSVTVGGASQVSGVTVNDFTSPVEYVVTAEDGSTAAYSVRVTSHFGLVINELDVDQVGTDRAEYVELYAAEQTDMTGVALALVNGGVTPGQGYAWIDLGQVGTLAADSYLVVAGPSVSVPGSAVRLTPTGWDLSNRIQNGPSDAVVLFDTIGARIIDTVTYAGTLSRAVIGELPGEWNVTEGEAGAPADSNSTPGSIGRSPNGRDTGQNGADFLFSATLTPGAANP